MTDTTHKFRRGLGVTIDVLQGYLLALKDKDEGAAISVHYLAQSLRLQAGEHGLPEICTAAEALLCSGGAPLLYSRLESLIAVLRGELSRVDKSEPVCLVMGGKPNINEEIARSLGTLHEGTACVGNVAEALTALNEQNVAAIILDLLLPGTDGLAFLVELRATPAWTSIPVLVLDEVGLSAPALADQLMCDRDAYLRGPLNSETIIEWVITAMHPKQATEAPNRDPLTGLLNRTAFVEEFDRILATHDLMKIPMALAAITVDRRDDSVPMLSKETYRRVLRRTGRLLATSFRGPDVISRWSENEFVVLFPGENQHGGVKAVEKVLAVFNHEKLKDENGDVLDLVLSGGVTVVSPSHPVNEVIDDADRYLCQAVTLGGNRICHVASDKPQCKDRILMLMEPSAILQVISSLFAREGCDLTVASREDDAIKALEVRFGFNLIIIDQLFGGRAGEVFLQRIRMDSRLDRVPVVMLMDGGVTDDVPRVLALGASDYVLRPIAPFKFMRLVRRLLTHATADETAAARTKSLLIVDDDATALCMAAAGLISQGGYRIFLARGTRDAAARLGHIKPDACLLAVSDNDSRNQEVLDVVISMLPADTQIVAVLDADAVHMHQRFASLSKCCGIFGRPLDLSSFPRRISEMLGMCGCLHSPPDAATLLTREIQRITRTALSDTLEGAGGESPHSIPLKKR